MKVKKGALSRQLGIKEKDNIPFTLLAKIIRSKYGTTIKNPTKSGKATLKITKLLKKRAVFANNLKRF